MHLFQMDGTSVTFHCPGAMGEYDRETDLFRSYALGQVAFAQNRKLVSGLPAIGRHGFTGLYLFSKSDFPVQWPWKYNRVTVKA